MANPGKSLDIALESSFEFGGFTIYPLTLGHSIVLEKIESPLMVGSQNVKSATDLIPTVFVMTRSAIESTRLLQLGRDMFDLEVVKWAETITFDKIFELIEIVSHLGDNLVELNKLSAKKSNEGFQMEVMETGQSSSPKHQRSLVGLFRKLWRRR